MTRLRVLLLLGAVVGACGCGAGMAGTRPAADPGARVTALADEYVREYFAANPLDATINDVPAPRHDDRWTDNSPETLARWHATEDRLLRQLAAIDPAALVGRPEWVTYGALREQLETGVAKRVCREELWYTRSDIGLTFVMGYVTSAQPVNSPAARGKTLARWKDFVRYLDVEIGNLERGLQAGYAGERGNVRRLITQMDELLNRPIEKTVLYDPARRAKDPDFGRQLTAVIASDVRPAIKRYRDFLATTYLPRARAQASVAATPGGAACYRAFLREGTSLPLGAEEIHRLGNERMQAIEAEMRVIARRSFQTEDLPALWQRLRTEPAFSFPDANAAVGCAREALARAKRAMPRAFGLLPRADLEVRRDDRGGGDHYQNSPGPGRPAIYWLAMSDTDKAPRHSCETTAFHEGIPGHHLQLTIALELGQKVHPVSRYFVVNSFNEGWALYSEQLADELGLFTGDLDRLGMLLLQAFRAARLVVDTGLHAKGWTRERAIEYMLAHTAEPRDFTEQEVDRYIGYPGQATGYMVGMVEILKLRAEARARLGAKFDLRQFHDRLLEDGNVTLPMLRAKVERWLAGAK